MLGGMGGKFVAGDAAILVGIGHRVCQLRGLLDAFTSAKRTAWQTVVKIVTTGFVLALMAGAMIKLKLFGGSAP